MASLMPAHPDFETRNAFSAQRSARDVLLIAQLQRVHRELHAMLVLAEQTPTGDSYDATLLRLRRDIDTLGRKFLRLSEKLLARSFATSSACSERRPARAVVNGPCRSVEA